MKNNENEVEFVNCDGYKVVEKDIVISKFYLDDNNCIYVVYGLRCGLLRRDFVTESEFTRLSKLKNVSCETIKEND